MLQKKKNRRGGKRKGAGRKRIKDKKIPVTVWFNKSIIKLYGGMVNFKSAVYASITANGIKGKRPG